MKLQEAFLSTGPAELPGTDCFQDDNQTREIYGMTRSVLQMVLEWKSKKHLASRPSILCYGTL